MLPLNTIAQRSIYPMFLCSYVLFDTKKKKSGLHQVFLALWDIPSNNVLCVLPSPALSLSSTEIIDADPESFWTGELNIKDARVVVIDRETMKTIHHHRNTQMH